MESPVLGDIPTDTRLIETLAWCPDAGHADADAHLDRMARSARALNIPFDRIVAMRRLATVSGDRPQRCRLTLGLDGGFEVTHTDISAHAPLWTLALASERLDPDDPWLRHKSTNRHLYDRARAALPDGVHELIFLNRRGELCEGTITNLFVRLDDGRQVTPPQACGVLPGVLRGRLLAGGEWREQVLRMPDLHRAEAIWVGNALRGLIPARFQVTDGANTA